MSLTKMSPSDSPESDDRMLVAEFRQTHAAEAFEALFERYGKRLYCFAYSFHRRVDLAEDCVQETFRRVIQQIERFGERNGEWNFWAWLVTIARDVCLSEWRRGRNPKKKPPGNGTREAVREPHTAGQLAYVWQT